MNFKKLFLLVFAALLLTVVGCSKDDNTDKADTSDSADSSSSTGGELKVAIISQPSTLDQHISGEAIVRDVGINIFETLMTLNNDYQPVPMLAESVDESNDGKTYTFHLREGVSFHNGKEMTAEDVLASMNRWKEYSNIAKENFQEATFEATDDYTITLNLKEPRLDTLELLAGQDYLPAIMPVEIIEEAGNEFIEDYIGTGPFKFVDWKQDQYIHMTKFEDYTPVESPADGLAGKKEALVDDLYFYITKDTSTLLSGIQTGEFDIAFSVAFDHYDQVKDDPNLNVYSAYFGTMNLAYNKQEGLFSDIKMRQAVNAALDAEDIMLGAFANPELYRLGSSYMSEDVVNWYSEAGKEAFNQGNPEKAKRLLDEAGYNGEEITLITNRDIQYHYDIAVIVQEQLNQLGMDVNLEVYDWATHLEVTDDPSNWDLLSSGLNYPTTPTQLLAVNPNWRGMTDDPKLIELMTSIKYADSLDDGKETWNELQEYAWTEYLPLTQFGSVPVIMAARTDVEGLIVMDRPIMMPLWNVKIN